jgi:hypothetical protein
MSRFKLLAGAAVAAGALGLGSLVAPPPAAAATCSQMVTMARYYKAMGDLEWYTTGDKVAADDWWRQAEELQVEYAVWCRGG